MLPVQYKKPRSINAVSVTVVLALCALGYAGWEFLRVTFHGQEAYRVLEETGSEFHGRRSLYVEDPRERDALRRKMTQQLREIGIDDPAAETWIELDESAGTGRGLGARFGVVYTAAYHWPFDVLPPIRRDIQLEHTPVPSP